LSAPPDPLAAIGGGVPTSKGEGRERMGKGKEGVGRGKEEEKGMGGTEGRGKEGRGDEGGKGQEREGSPCMHSHT